MYKYIVLSVFLTVFFFLIKKNRVYVIPFILVIFSNVNGLLDWEDFALHGVIKFQDYGLVITMLLLFPDPFKKHFQFVKGVATSFLFRVVSFFWAYYAFIFIYSIIQQGGAEWPIKMGRMFFYGIVVFVIYSELKPNPIVLFDKVTNVLMVCTLVFGLMYVCYNVLGIDFYPKEAYEEFKAAGISGEVKRNFAGFPSFALYFIITFVHRLMSQNNSKTLNFCGLMLMVACVVLTLTRGLIISMAAVVAVTILFRRPTVEVMRKALGVAIVVALATPFLFRFGKGHLEVLMLRFSEFAEAGGAGQSGNFLARTKEFSRIVENVVDFNPLFGFGFTNISELGLGYQSSLLHGGSADNGFSNLIGVTGFIGLGIFIVMMGAWLIVNIKLQILEKEPFSKINFIFILYIMVSMFNGAGMSYMHNYALFLVYDLLAYAYLIRQINQPCDTGSNITIPQISNIETGCCHA